MHAVRHSRLRLGLDICRRDHNKDREDKCIYQNMQSKITNAMYQHAKNANARPEGARPSERIRGP